MSQGQPRKRIGRWVDALSRLASSWRRPPESLPNFQRDYSHIRVGLATPSMAEQIAAMSRDEVEVGLGWQWTPQRVWESIRDRRCNVAVVREHQRVLAFAIMRYEETTAHLMLLAVRPEFRRKGFASALIRWLEDVAREAELRCIFVECRRNNDAARLLYLECGFYETTLQPRMYRRREDGIHLEKWLRTPEAASDWRRWPKTDRR